MLLGIYALYNVGAKSQQETDNRVRGLIQQQNGIERISRELRQATNITPGLLPDPRRHHVGASQRRHLVREAPCRYECSSATCKRWEGPFGGSLDSGPVPVITNVQNADVFRWSRTP